MRESIIINGIDVSGCSFLFERDNKQKCECCHATGFRVICDCDKWHNCYYKQLQREKAERQAIKKIKNQSPAFKKCEMHAEELREII